MQWKSYYSSRQYRDFCLLLWIFTFITYDQRLWVKLFLVFFWSGGVDGWLRFSLWAITWWFCFLVIFSGHLKKKVYGILSESQSTQNDLQTLIWPGPPLLVWSHVPYTSSVTTHFVIMPDMLLIRPLHLLFPLPGTLFARDPCGFSLPII